MPTPDQRCGADGSTHELESVPGDLFNSLVDFALKVPAGRTDFYLETSTGTLTEVSLPDDYYYGYLERTAQRLPYHPLCITKQGDQIRIQSSLSMDLRSTNPPIIWIEGDANRASKVLYENGDSNRAKFGVALTPYLESTEKSWIAQAGVNWPVINHILSISADFIGDANTLWLEKIEKLTTEQAAILIKDGHIPIIRLDQLIHDFVTGEYSHPNRIPTPDYTFDSEKHANVYGHNTTMLVKAGVPMPGVGIGEIISGIALTQEQRMPYKIDVQIIHLEERNIQYHNGPGKAVYLEVITNIFDGQKLTTQTHNFIAPGSLEWLNDHIADVPARAFAEAMPELKIHPDPAIN
jgi:hypothetical protein